MSALEEDRLTGWRFVLFNAAPAGANIIAPSNAPGCLRLFGCRSYAVATFYSVLTFPEPKPSLELLRAEELKEQP